MEPLPPDPYKALGLTPSATSTEIKSAYRRQALKCHPDKAPNKAEEFHRISSAYEILGDDEKKAQYDAEITLRKLKDELDRNERSSGGGGAGRSSRSNAAFAGHGGGSSGWAPPGVNIKTATYTFGNSRSAGVSSFFNEMNAPKTESRRTGMRSSPVSDRSAEENTFSASFAANVFKGFAPVAAEVLGGYAKKFMDGEYQTRPSTTQRKSSRQEEADRKNGSKSTKESQSQQERERLRKTKDKAEASDRRYKYTQRENVESNDSDDDISFKARQKESKRDVAAEYSRYEDANTRKRRESAAYDGGIYNARTRPHEKEVRDVHDYIKQAKSPLSPNPPNLSRSNTYTADAYESRRSPQAERPSMTRRTSTRQPEPRASPTKDTRYTDRRSSESAEYASSHRSSSRPQPPPLNTAYTSPPDLNRGAQSASTSRRAQTFDDYITTEPPSQRIHRSQTMPTEPELRRSSTRRTGTNNAPERSSNLRYAEVPNSNNDSGYSTSSPSEATQTTFAPPPKQRERERATGSKQYVDEEVRRFMGENVRPSMARQPSVSRSDAAPPRKSPERERDTGRERERERPDRPIIDTRAPPVSRSASFFANYASSASTATPISPMPNSASSKRRPSLSRTDSARNNSTSTRATSYDIRSPITPLKPSGFSYFDEGIAQSPVDYHSSRDAAAVRGERDAFASSSSRGKENVKRPVYAESRSSYAEPMTGYDIPIRDARPSGPTRRDSVNGGSVRGGGLSGGGGGERRAGPPSAYGGGGGGGYEAKPRTRRGSILGSW